MILSRVRTRPAGPPAFGLACGAHVAVEQGEDWHDPAGAGLSKLVLRERLASWWGVRGATEWQRMMDGLLAERGERPNDLALELRWQATVVRTVPPDLAGWRRIVRQAAEDGELSWHAVPMLIEAAERISRYEDRFRADGLLSPHGVVHGVRAYDWGRAANLARCGLRAGYCDRAAAEEAVLRVGELCARHYMSWSDLSAAFALGRLLAGDEDRYEALREAHRALLTEADSPWRTLAWPAHRPEPGGFRQVTRR
ncbi:DUF1266 domain-containing protein [Actinophytocola gossypii]|uniref:DUF1266 domain-containing protein n=1 Tax=Actinophytocola gossypii TaxID=2812003 RepID=A0ABT2JDC6_9PSEU|nr:DUF1266 domain-containing protein [Actinophytocola gossypii]MCT2585878.1 DUF1266 domain-containing protein [Actinophytocola gossypii]